MSFGSCCVSLLYIYVDECGNYLHEKCCSNQTIRMYDNLRHTISLCDINDTSNEREKRRYERISTIDYESQIAITIKFINITIVKLHFFPPPISVSLLLQLTLHCPNWHPLAFLALLAHHFDSTIFLSLFPNVESVARDDDKETSRFNTHFHFFI